MFVQNVADIDQMCACFNQLTREDIAKLEEWQRMQPHLPDPMHPIDIALFLQRCNFSIEKAKQRIDNYYTIRTHAPELFSNLDPLGDEVQQAMNTGIITVLPDRTPEGFGVMYTRLLDRNVNAYSFYGLGKTMDMMVGLALRQQGSYNGFIGVMDMEDVSFAHISKCHIMFLKTGMTYIHNALPIRIKALHFVNCVPFVDKVMALLQPFLKKRFPVYTHFGDNATIFKYVPKDILPIECGGSKLCANEYFNNVSRKLVESHSDYFKLEEKQIVDESQRPGEQDFMSVFFGANGTFKSLNVD